MDKRVQALESEIDKTLTDLRVDLKFAKDTFETGILYTFFFFDTAINICIPNYPPYDSGLVRAEFTIGTVDAKEISRILFAIALDFDMHRHHPIRVVPRTKDEKTYTVLLQLVGMVDLMQAGFIAQTILYGAELAEFYREEYLPQRFTA